MLSTVKNYIRKEKNIVLFIYLFIFLIPWNLVKSQVAIFSITLFIYTIIKYKDELFSKIQILWSFRPLLLLLTFIGYLFISTLWSESFAEGFHRVFNFHKYELLFIPVLLLLTAKQAKIAIKFLLISFTLYSVFSLLIYFDIVNIVGSSKADPKGILRYSISTQYMVIASFAATFVFWYSKNRDTKIFFSSLTLLSLFALFINNSRTSQLAFLFILLIFIFIFLKKYKSIKVYIVSLLFLVILTISFSQNEKMLDKFSVAVNEATQIYNEKIYSGSFGVRFYYNKVGVEIMKNHFFFGMGPVDNRNELVKQQEKDENYKFLVMKHFHSEHMEILTAYGIVGYLLLFGAIVSLIYSLRHNSLYFYISLSVYLTLFFVSFANKTLALKPLNYIYIIFFILLSIIAYKSEANSESEVKLENNG